MRNYFITDDEKLTSILRVLIHSIIKWVGNYKPLVIIKYQVYFCETGSGLTIP